MTDFSSSKRGVIEPLEARIAPALTAIASANWVTATLGAPIALHAGDGLSTGGANAGTYLLYVEKGDALVFITDLNNNGSVDFNEITGIAAGDGLSLVSFVDIHGDIATNLLKTTAIVGGAATTVLSLSDSDNDRSNDPLRLGDGRVLLNNRIDKIELRSLTVDDLSSDQNGDGVINDTDAYLRKAYTSYSIFGTVYAGRGFGVTGGGLILDSSGADGDIEGNFGFATNPSLGSIKTGTAASGEYFSFGVSNQDDLNGKFVTFTPPRGQAGGDIIGVKAVDPTMAFSIDSLIAGDGGVGARGGNVQNITLFGDDNSGYTIKAGNGGRGPSGGLGGSILGFTDLGSATGKVVIQSGSGGSASTGVGGNGGVLQFDTFNVYGNVNIDLGSGGDGFTAGGNGAALARGIFNQPDPVIPDPGEAVGTWHNSTKDFDGTLANGYQAVYDPKIGTHQAIDFDGDGNGDFVYTSKVTSQLVVMFGDGNGGFRTRVEADGSSVLDRIYLSGVRNAGALVVADLNGDGRPDIAVASDDEGSHAGIVVFLSKYEDGNNDGLQPIENVIADPVGDTVLNDFLGFESARFSAMPQLLTGDPTTANALLGYQLSPNQISSLTAGDFNGDGKVELAVVATYYTLPRLFDVATGITTELSAAHQIVVFMTPDQELNNLTGQTELTGQLYADFGTKATVVNGNPVAAAPKRPFFDPSGDGLTTTTMVTVAHTLDIESTALRTTSTYDVVITGFKSSVPIPPTVARTFEYPNPRTASATAGTPPAFVGNFNYGSVDTNRDTGGPEKISLEAVTLQDFTVTDLDGDGVADLAVLSGSPQGYLVGVKGSGTGGGTPNSGTGDNAGSYFGVKGFEFGTNYIAIKSMDGDNDGRYDELVVLKGSGSILSVTYQAGAMPTGPFPITLPPTPPPTTGAILLGGYNVLGGATIPDSYFLDVFIPKAASPGLPAVISSTEVNQADLTALAVLKVRTTGGAALVADQAILENGMKLSAGDGGNALVGKGGTGGVLGGGGKLVTITDSITGLKTTDYSGTLTINMSGTVRFLAGDGGNGFSSGGKGGSISGVVLRPLLDKDPTADFPFLPVSVALKSGFGGRGVSGAGGDGGDVSQNSIYSFGNALKQVARQFSIITGDGGDGRTGGDGGSVLGNGTKIYDAQSQTIIVTTGSGGDGQIKGGSGGAITNFSPIAGDPTSSTAGSSFFYTTGNGGNSASGAGGNGGSIIGSGPKPNDALATKLALTAGNGGDGRTGGNGGSIANFISTPTSVAQKLQTVTFIAGSGGDGTAGDGGNGGSISKVSVPTRGGGLSNGANFNYSRIISGDGGASAGAKGGNGGAVSDVKSSAESGSFAIIGGAGGDGLFSGGTGGSVLRSELTLSSLSVAKGLVIAGAGGDASAFIVNPNDSSPNQSDRAFGGRVGVGGKGGDINGFTQLGNTGVNIDLIAGNGGDTINFGTILDIKGYAGIGGSISNIKITGDIGNLNATTPIKKYNDDTATQTIAEWVDAHVRKAGGGPNTLSDSDGNVGIVVGVAGRNKAVVTDPGGNPTVYTKLPSTGIVNGSLMTVEARNIMSAVAGDVEAIAAIQVAKNIRVLNGIVGADKGAPGLKEYFDTTGVIIDHPVRDGALLDGAFIAKVILDASGRPGTLPGDRIFNL